jgi:hypothetical protein
MSVLPCFKTFLKYNFGTWNLSFFLGGVLVARPFVLFWHAWVLGGLGGGEDGGGFILMFYVLCVCIYFWRGFPVYFVAQNFQHFEIKVELDHGMPSLGLRIGVKSMQGVQKQSRFLFVCLQKFEKAFIFFIWLPSIPSLPFVNHLLFLTLFEFCHL